MSNPYSSLPETAFWRTAVADRQPLEIEGLWNPKHAISPGHKIATAGSCFAQHIGRALQARGYSWFNAEPLPSFVPESVARDFNYGVFSFRTGNIYTAALLRQWMAWAIEEARPPEEIWQENGRFYDPFRPAIEPEGFASADELIYSRTATLQAVRRVAEKSRVFVFTMGLTEGWVNKNHGYAYPMCPGTVHGTFDQSAHEFKNYRYSEILRDMRETMEMMKSINRGLRFLLTVSPVPLTATASGQHVLSATTYSKSVLRAVAGDLCNRGDTDYFPSYEIITGAPFKAMFYEANLRSVKSEGVAFVMDSFFKSLDAKLLEVPTNVVAPKHPKPSRPREVRPETEDSRHKAGKKLDTVCEDELLDAFAGNREP